MRQMSRSKNMVPAAGRARKATLALVVTCLIAGAGFAAYGAKALLHGQVSVSEQGNSKSASSVSHPTLTKPVLNSSLVDKYGDAAKSQAVAAAIQKIEQGSPRPTDAAKAASDAYEKLQKGIWTPDADPTTAIMLGYVPPNMPPEQVAFMAKHLPKLPRLQRRMPPTIPDATPMMPNPTLENPYGFSQTDLGSTRAANQQLIEQEMRERFGPVFMPGMRRGPARQPSTITSVTDHDGSIREMTDQSGNVVVDYAYDPFGNQTTIAGGTVHADFGFAGMFFHRRSGFYLTTTRPYSPVLGRFLTRDPIEEAGGINLYAYANNNPISLTDRDGLAPDIKINETGYGPQNFAPGSIYGGGSTNSFSSGGWRGASIPRAESVPLRSANPANWRMPGNDRRIPTENGGINIPNNYVPGPSRSGGGTVWRAPGTQGDANTIRTSPPNCPNNPVPGKPWPKHPYPNGSAREYNSGGQPIDIRTGKSGTEDATHNPILPGYYK